MENKDQKKVYSVLFRIAGHLIEVAMPSTKDWRLFIPSFAFFRCLERQKDEVSLFTVETVNSLGYLNLSSSKLLIESSDIIGDCFRLIETENQYIVDIQFVKGTEWHRMLCDKKFEKVTVCIQWSDPNAGHVLNAFLMIAFAQSSVLKHTLLLHASAVENGNHGYAFLGKSGTGKSTHSALWIEYIEGTKLLNDDNPAVRVEPDGNVYIYGTPWSGKTPCYRNSKHPLAALVRLKQDSSNFFLPCTDAKALIVLLPGCSSMRWNVSLYTALCDTLELIIKKVPVGLLSCLPDEEAARLCYNETNNINNKV